MPARLGAMDSTSEPENEQPPRDACGVFGVWAPGEDVAKLSYYGLYALQHRGQEAAGIAVSDGSTVLVYKDLGLVSQVFDEATLSSLTGHLAIGHTRYSTTGGCTWENAQPSFRANDSGGGIALGHNGNLTNTTELARQVARVVKGRVTLFSLARSDSDVPCSTTAWASNTANVSAARVLTGPVSTNISEPLALTTPPALANKSVKRMSAVSIG